MNKRITLKESSCIQLKRSVGKWPSHSYSRAQRTPVGGGVIGGVIRVDSTLL